MDHQLSHMYLGAEIFRDGEVLFDLYKLHMVLLVLMYRVDIED